MRSLICLIFICGICNVNAASSFFRPREMLDSKPVQTKEIPVDSRALVERIIKAYCLTSTTIEIRGNSLWQGIFNERHAAIDQVFKSGQLGYAEALLSRPHTSDLLYGIDNLCASILASFNKPGTAKDYADLCLDGLVRFAEAIGAMPLYNPENNAHLKGLHLRGDDVITKIDSALGLTISFPNPYPYEDGFFISRGVVSYRVPQALYQAWRIKQLLRDIPNPRVLEIGGGVGRTAYYARELGIKDYTIIDLPFTATISGYFLGRTLGEDHVLFFGEESPNADQLVKVLPPQEFFSSDEKYDLIINVDSLTEMDPLVAQAYLDKIEKSTRIFLSINHETNQFTVKNLIDKSSQVSQVDRTPYWMRNGYVEELVRFKPF